MVLDLDLVSAQHGPRGLSRLVLHEFGHVVDYAIVPSAIDAQLNAGIPTGYSCVPGQPTSSCAPRHAAVMTCAASVGVCA